MVLKELSLVYDIVFELKSVNRTNLEQLSLADQQINKLIKINDNNQKQIELLELQLKTKKKGGWLVPALVGVVGGLFLGAVL